jgi:hypothetical protein
MHFFDRDPEGLAQNIRQHCRDGAKQFVTSLPEGLALTLLLELSRRFPPRDPPPRLFLARLPKGGKGSAR